MWDKIFQKILDVNFQRNIAIFIFIIVIAMFIHSCQKNSIEVEIYEQNEKALASRIDTLKTINGKLEYAKKLLIGDYDKLKELNNSLAESLKVEIGKVKYIEVVNLKFVHDTIYIAADTIYKNVDGSFTAFWKYSKSGEEWKKQLSGYTNFCFDTSKNIPTNVFTVITDDYLELKLTSGFRERDGYYETFINSSYPNINFDFASAVVDDQIIYKVQKSWHIGLIGGLGYGINSEKLIDKPTVFIGIGISWTPFSWLNF